MLFVFQPKKVTEGQTEPIAISPFGWGVWGVIMTNDNKHQMGSCVVRGLIDTVVVLPMSTSWTPMFDPELRQYASSGPSPCGFTVVDKIPHH